MLSEDLVVAFLFEDTPPLEALNGSGGVSASSVHAEFGSSVHAGPDRLCTRAFFAPDRLYTQCLLLCTRRDRGVDSCMFPCLSVV